MTMRSATTMIAVILARQLRSRFGRRLRYLPVFLDANRHLLDDVDALVVAGQLVVPIERRYPMDLEGVLAALAESRSGRVRGKLVVEAVPG